MKYAFFPELLVRVPLYSYKDYATTNYSTLLRSDQFQTAIFLSSQAFYEELSKKNFEFEALNEKQQSAVIKYFNRASFRSTPFGIFSSFSLAPWSADPNATIRLSSTQTPFIKPDFSVLVSMHNTLMSSSATKSVRLFPNTSLYFTDTDIRYVKTNIDEKDQTLFSMISLKRNSIIKQVAAFCAAGKTINELKTYIMEEAGAEVNEAMAFIKELYEQEILIVDTRPNVTGDFFTTNLLEKFETTYTAPAESRLIKELVQLMDNPGENMQRSLAEVSKGLSKYLSLQPSLKSHFYAVAERATLAGGLPQTYQKQLQQGLNCLAAFSRTEAPDDLVKFKKDFIARYESREVPLLEALDPQLGIGYGSFDSIKDDLGILDHLDMVKEKGNSSSRTSKDLGSLLLREWQAVSNNDASRELVITDAHLERLAEMSIQRKFPPSISVMFRLAEDQVFFEHAGSNSALSLLGRFSCSNNVLEFGKTIASTEQAANPEVVFAEISHVCNIHAANINQRAHLREYEIPVLTFSSLPAERQITLSDLHLSVINDTVILWSRKLKKIVVPRLATAYNYAKSNLPIFRFFCDLQSQDLHSNLLFSLSQIVPGLKFYPRIRYKSCILQAAEWHLEESDLKHIQQATPAQQPGLFRDFCHQHGIPASFAYSFFDNFITYNQRSEEDILNFLKEIKGKASMVLKEFPFAETDSKVTDEQGRPLLAQYVASLHLQEKVYSGQAYHQFNNSRVAQLRDTSGWLYFKIYCHTLSSDEILTDHLIPLLDKAIKKEMIINWFWIRYNDPDTHIRLRIQPARNSYGDCFELFSTRLNKLFALKTVDRFHTEQYKRETERYSIELMREVEKIFEISSGLVGSLLKSKKKYGWDDYQILAEAVVGIRTMLHGYGYADADKAQFCKEQFGHFFLEFGSPKELKPAAEKIHKVIAPAITKMLSDEKYEAQYAKLKKGMALLKKGFEHKKVKSIRREQLAADLIHMHLNRLFPRKQRYYEMVSYFLAMRSLSSEAFRQKKDPLSL